MNATSTPTTGHLEVPGARLHFEIRGQGPLLVLHAAPMPAGSFAPAADLLAAHFTVLTSDPRGIAGSTVADPDRNIHPDERADDLAALLEHTGIGPAIVFGSSGGAVSALSLLQRNPALVRTVVAHEPPLIQLLPDRDKLRRQTEDMVTTYLAGDRTGAWRMFLDIANIEMPQPVFDAVFGQPPTGRAADDEHFSFARMEAPTSFWSPSIATLSTVSGQLIIGVGDDSTDQLCDRTAHALAGALRLPVTRFPGGHIGFVDNPGSFAARLCDVLAAVTKP